MSRIIQHHLAMALLFVLYRCFVSFEVYAVVFRVGCIFVTLTATVSMILDTDMDSCIVRKRECCTVPFDVCCYSMLF